MRTLKWLIVVVAVLLAVGAGFWAGRMTLAPAALPDDVEPSALVVAVTEATVGRTLNLNVTVTQPKHAVATNMLTGVVTRVAEPGSFSNGGVLYEVGGLPVRVVQGGFPFWRDLAMEDSGRDVKQLRDILVALGYQDETGDFYSWATGEAVKKWQTTLGAAPTGLVTLGELVVVPKVPVALALDDEVAGVGSVLSGGERFVLGASGKPVFDLVVSREQARLVPQTSTVVMEHQGKKWTGLITGSENDQQGQTVFHLAAAAGGPVCGGDCGLLPAGDEVYLLAKVQVIAPASGPAVPVAAVSTNASGQAVVRVVSASGEIQERPVTVLGSQDGVAVVKGVSPGEKVQVFAPGGGSIPPGTTAPQESSPSASASR